MKKNREKTSVYLKKVLNQLSFLILLACSLLISPQIKAANSIFEQDYQLQLSFENAPLERVLDAITEQSGVKIVYSSDVVDASRKVTVNIKTSDILVALQSVFGKDYSFKQIEDFLINHASQQIIDSLAIPVGTREQISAQHFLDLPRLFKNETPTAADFGRMEPRQKLKLMYSKKAGVDLLVKMMSSGYKIVKNKNLLTYKGAARYAKQIGGAFAPVRDYDGDGMPDFFIYDKQGNIAAINGHRIKRDDKAQFKRLFYQLYPDPRMQKAKGGFEGW